MQKPFTKASIWGLLVITLLIAEPPGYAQTFAMLQEKPKANAQPKLNLRDVLNDLKNSYQVDIMYELKSVEGLTISGDAINKSQNLEKNLQNVLTPLGLKYKKVNANSYLVIAEKKAKKTASVNSANTTGLLPAHDLLAETSLPEHPEETGEAKADRNISGKVTDEQGEGLPGVSIVVKGTQRGTTTDVKGIFELSLPDGDATLIFSFVGYLSQEISAGNRSSFAISLQSDSKSLEEMVVVGYGSAKKKDLTGAVTRVDLEQSRLQPNVNPVQALRGTVAGVTITDNGRPGSDASIMIRGRKSISASSNPLIVLDGIIYAGGSLSDINSNDIESIDILKDASSSAIYGSLAANGVILVTTKKGVTAKPRISINSYFGTSDFAHAPDYRNAEQYLQARKDAEIADKGPLPFQLLEEANIASGTTIDPWEEIKRKAPVSSNELSVSGRTERVNYYFSGSYTDVKSPVKGDNFNRVAARVNLDVMITDWLSIGTNSGYSIKDNSGVRADLGMASQISPYANLYYEDGVPRPLPMNIGAVGNPLTKTLRNSNYNVTKTLFTNSYTDIKLPLPGLTHRLNIGFTDKGTEEYNYTPSFKREQFFNLGNGSKEHYAFQNLAIENILKYDKIIALDHALNVTLLYGTYTDKDQKSVLSSNNIFNDVLGYNALEIGENFAINTDAGKSQQVSSMGRLGYRYKGKYILDLTLRRDGYSAFGNGKKYGLFPAIGVSWNVSDEAFMSNMKAIDNLKLRTSWGKNGNRGVSRYSSLSSISQTNYVFGDGSSPSVGLYTSSLGNPDLGWETTKSTNFGVDISVLSGRISGSVDYYQTRTNDLLLRQSIPIMTGFTTFLRNIGETENKGLEISLNTTNVQKSGFAWNTRFVFTLNRNKITKLTGNDLNGDGVEDDDITSKWFIGHPLGSNFDYVFDGIYQTGDDLTTTPGAIPGHIRFKDINDDGVITPADRKVIGSSQASFTTGITNTFSFKGVSLMVLFNVRQGGQSSNSTLNPGTNYYDLFNTLNVPYWTPENPSNTHAAINYRNPLGYDFYQDRSFVRLQDVSLSYDLPASLLNKAKIHAIKVYTSGKNLITWTKWNGWDPEHGVGGRSPVENGPLLKTFTLGLNIQL